MNRAGVVLAVGASVAAAVAVLIDREDAASAASQAWPPFVLVTGLLLIGLVANRDGVFLAAADRISGVRVGTRGLFVLAMALVAAVTVVLTLDTAVVFLTPILFALARRRGVDERPYLYGCVFMANAGSLLLPGSNLTNLLVLGSSHSKGADFAIAMLPLWLAAVVVTTAVVLWLERTLLATPSAATDQRSALTSPIGLLATALAAVLVLVLHSPAVPVLVLGGGVVVAYALSGRLARADITRSVDVPLLVGLFAAAVAVGTIARVWSAPAELMTSGSRLTTLAVATFAANAINNLPATMLLTSRAVAHPRALLLGLDVGSHLLVSGSLATLLWLRIGRQSGATLSARRFTQMGLVMVPLTFVAAAAAVAIVGPARF